MNKLIALMITVAVVFAMPGCWDVRDVTNRAFVTSIGLDAADNGYKVTVKMPKPAQIRNRSTQVFTVSQTAEAESISKAIQILQSRLARDISFSHLRVLVIGEKLARQKNFNDLISFISKNPEIALRFKLIFVEGGEARDVLKGVPLFDRSISSELVGLSEAGDDLGFARSKRFYDILADLRITDGTAVGTKIIYKKQDEEVLARIGGAIFNNWRLTGSLNADEMQMANWILRQNPRIIVRCRMGQGEYSYIVETKSHKIIPKNKNGRLGFDVHIKSIGSIIEQQGSSLDLSEPKNLDRLKAVLTETIWQQVSRAVYKSQKELGIDYLGFNRALQQQDPKLYEKLDWPKVYPDVPVDIKVDVRIPRFGSERR